MFGFFKKKPRPVVPTPVAPAQKPPAKDGCCTRPVKKPGQQQRTRPSRAR